MAEVDRLTRLFKETDLDGTGSISQEELVPLIKRVYQQGGIARNLNTVRAEVTKAMLAYDEDVSGVLELPEFIRMFAECKEFSFNEEGNAAGAIMNIDPAVMSIVSDIGQRMTSQRKDYLAASILIQSRIRGKFVRAICQDSANAAFITRIPGSRLGEYTISHTWLVTDEKLGIKFKVRFYDYPMFEQ